MELPKPKSLRQEIRPYLLSRPCVTSIENSIFLVNCNDAYINDQDGCGTLKRQVFDNPVSSFAGSTTK